MEPEIHKHLSSWFTVESLPIFPQTGLTYSGSEVGGKILDGDGVSYSSLAFPQVPERTPGARGQKPQA